MMRNQPPELVAIKGEVSIIDMDTVSREEDHLVVVEAGEEAGGEANPRETQIGARRWVAFMQRTLWR